jgi:hypothetical protein
MKKKPKIAKIVTKGKAIPTKIKIPSKAFINDYTYTITFVPHIEDNTFGLFMARNHSILIDGSLHPCDMAKTLIHEFSHGYAFTEGHDFDNKEAFMKAIEGVVMKLLDKKNSVLLDFIIACTRGEQKKSLYQNEENKNVEEID